MLKVLVALQAAALVVGVPLLWLYVKERVTNLAREASDRALADYRHSHERSLAATNAEHQRRVHESSLYAREKHRAYAELYRRVRTADGLYENLIGLTFAPRFEDYAAADVRDYAIRNKVPERLIEPALQALMAGERRKAGGLLSDLHTKVQKHAAEKSFMRAKNFEALHELYFSDEVRAAMEHVRQTMAQVSVSLMRNDDERDTKQYEKKQAMSAAVARLYSVMREELWLGYSTVERAATVQEIGEGKPANAPGSLPPG